MSVYVYVLLMFNEIRELVYFMKYELLELFISAICALYVINYMLYDTLELLHFYR